MLVSGSACWAGYLKPGKSWKAQGHVKNDLSPQPTAFPRSGMLRFTTLETSLRVEISNVVPEPLLVMHASRQRPV